jgi:hypothetical protein
MSKLLGTDPNLPNYARPEYLAVAPDLKLIGDELGGTRAMHAASEQYIRKWSAEQKPNFDIRRLCENFFEGLGRTLSAAIGMLFAKPPVMEWGKAEEAMAPHWDNIDMAGTKGTVFIKRFAEEALRDGLAILIVDHPSAPAGVVVTKANEQALNLRPRWARYARSCAINWYVETVNNDSVLTLLVLHEPATERVGLFGVQTVNRFRVLRLVPNAESGKYEASWNLYEQKEGTGDESTFVEVGTGGVFRNRLGQVAERLPVAIAYTGKTDGQMHAKPPLLGVAWANLSHWQLSTDLRFNTSVAGFAQPTVIGNLAVNPQTGQPVALEIGPLVTVQVQENGDFKWTEAKGSGLERLAGLVFAKLTEMAQMGLSFLQTDTRAAETAEAKRLDAAAENATLATAAQGIEDAINEALRWHGWYQGIPDDSVPALTLNRDYGDTTIAADIMSAYVKAVNEAGLPVRLLLQAFQQGGRIPSDADLDEIELEVQANAEAQRQAEEEAAAAERESRAAA